MKLFKLTIVTSDESVHEYFVIAEDGTKAKQIVQENTNLKIIQFKGIEHKKIENPMLICKKDI